MDRGRRKVAIWAVGMLLLPLLAFWLAIAFNDVRFAGFRAPSANWIGSFESLEHSGVTGKLALRMPEPLPIGEDFSITADLYYNLWVLAQPRPGQMLGGQGVVLTFVGRIDAAGAIVAREVLPDRLPRYGYPFRSADDDAKLPMFTLSGSMSDDGKTISASYRLGADDDHGNLVLERR